MHQQSAVWEAASTASARPSGRHWVRRLSPVLMLWFSRAAVRLAYRVEWKGQEHIPREGAALLACNHVSFVDALIVLSASPRPIRFLVDSDIYDSPALRPILSACNAIPIAPAKVDAALLARAYDEVASALEAGELVAIFPEGQITRTGELSPFRAGVSRILERTPVPVVPLALKGLWGSFFSRCGGRAMTRPFRRGAFSRICLEAAEPMPPSAASPDRLQERIRALRGEWK